MSNLTINSDTAKGLEVLKALKLAHLRAQHPSLPERFIPVPKYSDRTANDLTKAIIDFLKLSGNQAERISTTGRLLDRTQVFTDVLGGRKKVGSATWIKGSGTRGSADVSATIANSSGVGVSVKIEVKMKDHQSPEQCRYQSEVESAGGVYKVFRTFQSFYEWYLQFTKTN